MGRVDGQIGARREADHVVRIRKLRGLVDVIHTPDQSALEIAPRPEVLDVQIADGDDRRRVGGVVADPWPELLPAVERPAQKSERVVMHQLVLEGEIRADDGRTARHPALVRQRRLFERRKIFECHRGPDTMSRSESAMRRNQRAGTRGRQPDCGGRGHYEPERSHEGLIDHPPGVRAVIRRKRRCYARVFQIRAGQLRKLAIDDDAFRRR